MNNKADREAKGKPLNRLGVVEKLEFFQRIIREWAFLLTPAEIVVIQAIADRTIMWGESERRIKLSHLLNGIPGHSYGLNMSERHFRRLVDSLIEKGLIRRTQGYYESNYVVQLDDYVEVCIKRLWDEKKLPEAKAWRLIERIRENNNARKT